LCLDFLEEDCGAFGRLLEKQGRVKQNIYWLIGKEIISIC
jgi:hypothetical protein